VRYTPHVLSVETNSLIKKSQNSNQKTHYLRSRGGNYY
jgi:hypothetical protein